jgi:D-serine deaminase-like pyridoxal phosphate-dependent protein
MSAWYEIVNSHEIASPALLIYPERVRQNISRMLEMAHDPARVRPHVKTHKMAEIVQMQLSAGISQFKCATIAEAEMVAACGALDVLLAYQPVGPNIERMGRLVARYPSTRFSALADDAQTVTNLEAAGVRIGLYLDIDCGMHRSGILPGRMAEALYRRIRESSVVWAAGLHLYDGHIKSGTVAERQRAVEEAFAALAELRERLESQGWRVPQIVVGGSPTFGIHAQQADYQCSPGTTLLWDGSYEMKFPEMGFLQAAIVLTRVISKPASDLLCLDLGYKAVSADNTNPRVLFPELPDAEMQVHSEEHLTVRTRRANQFGLGDALYGIPWHVCPTVALYSEAVVVRDGKAGERWKVAARDRVLSI